MFFLETSGFEADTIFSCLQSLRLVQHAWLRPFEERLLSRVRNTAGSPTGASNSTSSLQRKKFVQFFKRGGLNLSMSTSDLATHPPLAFEESILLTGILSNPDKPKTEASLNSETLEEDGSVERIPGEGTTSEQLIPSLSVLTAVVKSAVLCSDLFTTREQFLWLIGCLQAG